MGALNFLASEGMLKKSENVMRDQLIKRPVSKIGEKPPNPSGKLRRKKRIISLIKDFLTREELERKTDKDVCS